MHVRTYWTLQLIAYLLLAALFASSFIANDVRDNHPGILRIISTDDGHYHARVKAALLHRWGEVRNGVTGGEHPAIGGPPAIVETIVGGAFSWTTLKAPQVMMLLTIFVTPCIVFLLCGLLRKIGMGEGWSLVGMAAYLLVFMGPLQKPVNMSLSIPITIAALLTLQWVCRSPRLLPVLICGMLIGVLPAVYFWSWTFVWTTTAIFFLVHCTFVPGSKRKRAQTIALCSVLILTFLVSLPFLLDMLHSSKTDPNFAATALRSTIVLTHAIESIPRTILLTVLLLSAILLVRRSRSKTQEWLLPLSVLLGIFMSMYQNVIHGVRFTFSSHYYPFVCLSALLIGIWACAHAKKGTLRFAVVGMASVFLLAGLWDYRSVWDIVRGEYYVRNIQHLSPALHLLDDDVRQTILTDKTSAHMVTTWTDDDVVYTAYIKHLLIGDEEYAERYCLSELFNPAGPDLTWLAREVVETGDGAEIERRRAQFAAICAPVREHHRTFLRKYGVDFVLWNERLHPEWHISSAYKLQKRGAGWSLWVAPS